MNFFCRILGHTWVPKAENPKTAWNVDKSGQLLAPRPAGEVRFYDECARCRERRDVPTPPRAKAG
jgi:hypothetical protein